MRPSVLNSKLLSLFLIEKDTNKEIIGVNFYQKKITTLSFLNYNFKYISYLMPLLFFFIDLY